MRRARLWGPLALLAGLLPTVVMTATATHVIAGDRPLTPREKVLAAIPNDPAVLINVKYRDMPASPDILELGKRSTKALERCLADNVEVGIRVQCAVTLHALGDRRALPTLQAALEDWEVRVRYEVVRALGAIPDASSVDPLIALYRRKDESDWVRTAILRSLGMISDQKVVRMLRDELRKKPAPEDPDLRPEVFDALWHNRHLMGRTTLIADTRAALASDNDRLVHSATLAAAELRSPQHTQALIPLMEHPSTEVRNKAVYALGRIGDKTATQALLDRLPKVRESRMLNNIAFALERLDKNAFYAAIKDVVEHKQAIIRLNAAFVLGDVRHPEGLPMLEEALKDASDFVRTSAIVAVGKLSTDDTQRARALASLAPFVDHENLAVREEAIYAVDRLTEGGRADLVHDKLYRLDARRHHRVVHRAAQALAAADDPRVREYILQCLIYSSCRAQEVDGYLVKHKNESVESRLLVAWARGHHHLTPLLMQIEPAGTLPVARGALEDAWDAPRSYTTTTSLQLLGSLNEPKGLPLVQRRANADEIMTRVHSWVAAVRLGDGAAADKLTREMDLIPAEWLPELVDAVGIAADARDVLGPKLEAKQKDANVDVALAAAAIRLQWTPDDAIFRLLEGLASPSSYERRLAERYLVRNRTDRVTWLLRRALAREGREDVADRLRALVDRR